MESVKLIRKISPFLVALSGGGIILFLGVFFYLVQGLPSLEQITNRQVSQSTKIYDREGQVLLYEISGGQKRTVVPLEDIPKHLRDATIAIEDERFYEEPAFDWRGYLRALWTNIRHGEIRQGGSTITIQLARNAFLTPEQTVWRKLRELFLAVRLGQQYSKDEILSLYLNEIPYGPTIYGVEAASQAYFSKPAKDLNLAESALVAALPKAPTYYSPFGGHVKELLSRQQLILNKMHELGKITEEEYDAAAGHRVIFAEQSRGIKAPHFVIAVQDYLLQKYGEELVQRGGLRVITSLDWKLQELAESTVLEGAERNEGLYKGKNAALVAQDPKTGHILALVGSRDYFDTENEGNFSVATQGLRQPGSALKPFVYLTAFQRGYAPDTVVFDVPTEFAANNPLCPAAPDFLNDKKVCFHPENFDDRFRGPVSLRTALAQSINVPAVKVLYLAGLRDAIANAYRFGLTTLTNPDLYGLSLVLGGGAVKLVDLVEAYSVLAQDGMKHPQTMVLEVRDGDGKILESYRDRPERVADEQSVRLVNDILSDTEARAGLFQGSFDLTIFPGHDVALKTGTSNDYRDAWAVGYTPSLVVGVWAGNNDNSPMQRQGSSILAAVPIWHAFMAEALTDRILEAFGRPERFIPQKPILAGDYLDKGEVHTILFYVDREAPSGPSPSSPGAADPQFANWEAAVAAWAEKNLSGGPGGEVSRSDALAAGLSPKPVVEIREPRPGGFVEPGSSALFFARSQAPIEKIRVYWNGEVIYEAAGGGLKDLSMTVPLSFGEARAQNLLEIEVSDSEGASGKDSVIVYH